MGGGEGKKGGRRGREEGSCDHRPLPPSSHSYISMRGKPVLIIRHSLFVYLDSVPKGISLIYSLLSAINADNVDRLISRPARAASLALRMDDFISLSRYSRGSKGFICSPRVIFAVSRRRLRPLDTIA